MPELPEVETVARDLRPRLVGATIVGARCSWARTLRTHAPEAFAEAVAGRTVEAVGRRAKQVVIDLSGDAALTIHLKMTGQLFVVPVGTPEDPYIRLVLELADGRELRFRDIRKFGRVGLYGRDPVTGELVTEVGGGAVFAAIGPEPLDAAFTVRDFRRRLRRRKGRLKPLLLDQSFLAGVGNIYADEALWLSRLHPLRSASTLRPPDERRLYEAIRSVLTEAVARRGSSIDDYTAPDGDGAMQERLAVYQRTGEPCPRCGRPLRRIVVGARSTHFCSWCQRLPAGDRASARTILRTMTGGHRRHGRRWTDVEGLGPPSIEPPAAARLGQSARSGPRRPGARPHGRRRRLGRRLMSILRFTEGHARGRGVRHPRSDRRRDGAGRPGRPGRSQRGGKTTLLRLAAGRDEPDRGQVVRKRSLTFGLLAQEAHLDEVFMAAPDLRTAVRSGAAHLERMAEALATYERDRRVTEPAYANLQHEFEVLGGYTLDQRVDSALSGLGFERGEWIKPPASMSGGEQTRASLARLVIADPDLLLLDEPTNHLDLDALGVARGPPAPAGRIAAGRVARPGVPRRDRDRVWELRDRRLTAFRGDYSAYHRQRVERDARATKDVTTGRGRSPASRNSSSATGATASSARCTSTRRASSGSRPRSVEAPEGGASSRSRRRARRRRADTLGRDRRPARRARRRLPAGTRCPGRRWDAGDRAARRGTVPFLAAHRGERIGIVGPNGAGKTTLLRTIAGELPPLDGSSRSATPSSSGTSPSCARRPSPARRCSTRCSRPSRSRQARHARTSPASCSAATTWSRRSGRSRAGSDRASNWRCSGSSRRTCCSSTNPRTISTSRPARRSSRS